MKSSEFVAQIKCARNLVLTFKYNVENCLSRQLMSTVPAHELHLSSSNGPCTALEPAPLACRALYLNGSCHRRIFSAQEWRSLYAITAVPFSELIETHSLKYRNSSVWFFLKQGLSNWFLRQFYTYYRKKSLELNLS